MKRATIFLLLSCIFTGIVSVGLVLSGTTGKISGRIVDGDTKDELPMVNVMIEGTTIGATTDLNGYYTILQVPPGTYTVKASMMGYKIMKTTQVAISVDLTTTVNFKMAPTVLDLGEEITIVAERPIVQISQTSSSHRVNRETIENMPVSNMRDLVATQAGVVGEGLHINVRGGRTGEILTVVDGQSVRDPLFSQASRTTSEQVMDFSSNPVDELTGRSGGMTIPANAIAEMEIITGGFDAEYGNALSAIVNVVTREGGRKFSGRMEYMTDNFRHGDYRTIWGEGTGLRKYSHNTDNFAFSLGGPVPYMTKILPVRSVTFFLSATGGFSDVTSAFDVPYYAPTTEDRADDMHDTMFGIKLPFEYGDRMDNNYNSLAHVAIRFTPNHKLNLKYQTDKSWYDEYNHSFSQIPENFYQRKEDSRTITLNWNHTLSPMTYYETMIAYFGTHFHMQPGHMEPQDVYEYWDSLEGRMGDERGRQVIDYDQDGFSDVGFPARATWHDRETEKWTFRSDLASQVTRHHFMKTGLIVEHYRMTKAEIKYPYRLYNGRKLDNGPWPELGLFRDFYTRYPTTIKMYIQDVIEYETLIIRFGLRYELWSPGKQVNDSVEGDKIIPGQELNYKHVFMPRLGVSHPITERDKLSFYFGRFTQNPDWRFIYMQDTQASGAYKVFGNPNLSAEEVTAYEVALDHGFNDELSMRLSGFFKDYNGLLNTETRGTFETYSVYVNRDYGSVRGFEVKVEKRYSNYTSGNINYAYTYAMGKSSSYRQGYDFGHRGQPIPIREWPLNWDVRHSVNILGDFRIPRGQAPVILGLRIPDGWGVNMMWKIESGKPYTPSGRSADQYTTTNSARTPYRTWVNLRINKDFKFSGLKLQLLCEVENLFNRRNVRAVNTEAGDPLGMMRPEDINPAAFGVGRNIMLGAAIDW